MLVFYSSFFSQATHKVASTSLSPRLWAYPYLTRKYWTTLKRLARDKHSSLLWKSVNYGLKKFYKIDTRSSVNIFISFSSSSKLTWGQCYKTFFFFVTDAAAADKLARVFVPAKFFQVSLTLASKIVVCVPVKNRLNLKKRKVQTH